jgi:hypothetical protein
MAPRIAADAPVVFAATGWSEPVPGQEFHPLESGAFHGALLRQPGATMGTASPSRNSSTSIEPMALNVLLAARAVL